MFCGGKWNISESRVSMTRKCHHHRPHTNTQHHEEETHRTLTVTRQHMARAVKVKQMISKLGQTLIIEQEHTQYVTTHPKQRRRQLTMNQQKQNHLLRIKIFRCHQGEVGNLIINEPRHEISINVVCATSKASDQPAHTRSLIRAFASRLNIL